MSSDWLRSASFGMELARHRSADGMYRKCVSRLSRCIPIYDIYFYAIHIRTYKVRMDALIVVQTGDKQSKDLSTLPPSVS